MVAKDKVSDFIDMYHENEILNKCNILRVLPSGNYHIYTFKITLPEQKEEIKKIQDDWI